MDLSMGEIFALAIGGLLALAGMISTIGGAVEKKAKYYTLVEAYGYIKNAEKQLAKVKAAGFTGAFITNK